MQIIRLKGLIESADSQRVTVACEKSGREFSFCPGDLPEARIGDKIDMLIAPSEEEGDFATVISIKSQKKVKPLKMPNFSTLVGHMLKTRDRLKATLAESADSEVHNELNEKIAWLDRGISLFS